MGGGLEKVQKSIDPLHSRTETEFTLKYHRHSLAGPVEEGYAKLMGH